MLQQVLQATREFQNAQNRARQDVGWFQKVAGFVTSGMAFIHGIFNSLRADNTGNNAEQGQDAPRPGADEGFAQDFPVSIL